MPTVPPQTEARHYFRDVESLVFAILGTLLVMFSIPAIHPDNWMFSFFAALCSVSVIIPASLAMRRGRKQLPTEMTEAHKRMEKMVALDNLLFGMLIVVSAWFFPNHGFGRITVPILAAELLLYLVVTSEIVMFRPYAYAGIGTLAAALGPFYLMAKPTAPAVAGLLTGVMLWIASFLAFTRDWQK